MYGASEIARSRLRKRKEATGNVIEQLIDAPVVKTIMDKSPTNTPDQPPIEPHVPVGQVPKIKNVQRRVITPENTSLPSTELPLTELPSTELRTGRTGNTSPQSNSPLRQGFDGQAGQLASAAATQQDPDETQETYNIPMELRSANEFEEKKESTEVEPEEIEFHFENASLLNLIAQIEEIFGITFITDDILDPLPKDGKTIKGNKISFKTHQPLTKRQAWNLFVTFLDIAGFNIVPMPEPKMFRIQKFASVLKAAVRSYIGVDPDTLPENEEIIRYVYFIENSTVEAITNIVNSLKGAGAELISLREHRGFILTDKAYNIKMLMKIVKELDQVSMPQSMSVLKLLRTDAIEVKKLYDSLINADEKQDYTSRLFASRKQPTSSYFPENTRIIAEPRTNTLILLGSQDAIQKIEEFIVKNVDVDIDVPYPRLQPVKLKYADAATVAEILTGLTKFGSDTPAGKSGGVRGGDKYLKSMSFTPVRETNTLIIQGDYDDYLQVLEIVKELDAPQPQIAVEVLVISITNNDKKQLGTQLRSKVPGSTQGILGNNVVFQTSGFLASGSPSNVVENTSASLGVQRLLGNLANLANTAAQGNTLLTLGADMFGVWGIFNILQTVTNAQIISNPFMIVSNKAEAKIELGEARRIVESQIIPSAGPTQVSEKNDQAVLSVTVTPQINADDGKIILNIVIVNDEYLEPASGAPSSGNKNHKEIVTSTMVSDGEVLALGGITRNKIEHQLNKVPVLGDIPGLGWFFKNKEKKETKENLLILFSTRIIEPDVPTTANKFTQEKIADYHETMCDMHDVSEARDPIYQMFFAMRSDGTEAIVDEFIFERAEIKGSAGASVEKKEKHKKRAETAAAATQRTKEIYSDNPRTTTDGTTLKQKPAIAPEAAPQKLSQSTALDRKRNNKKNQKALADYLPTDAEARA